MIHPKICVYKYIIIICYQYLEFLQNSYTSVYIYTLSFIYIFVLAYIYIYIFNHIYILYTHIFRIQKIVTGPSSKLQDLPRHRLRDCRVRVPSPFRCDSEFLRNQNGRHSWRIIPVSKWLVTPIYKPYRPFIRDITLLRGLTNHGY